MRLADLSEIEASFEFFDNWEDKYRFIIDLGRDIPIMPDSERIEANIVRGCQSQVWMVPEFDKNSNQLHFRIDSDAHIVRGLIAIVQVAYQDLSPEEILRFDMDTLFLNLDLLSHLSATRGNGLRALVQRCKYEAENRTKLQAVRS